MTAATRTARLARAVWGFCAVTAVCGSSCGSGRTALATLARDAQSDLGADTAGGGSKTDLRAPSDGGDTGGSGGRDVNRVNGGGGGAGYAGGGVAGYAGAGGAGYAGAGGSAGGPSGGSVARGGSSGQGGRGGSAVGGAKGGAAGMGRLGGSSGNGGVSGSGGGPATGGTTGAIRDGGVADRPGEAAEVGTDGPVRWRNSANSLCVPLSVGSGSASVYSDALGLFVMTWSSQDSTPAGASPATLWANDGSGWRTHFTWSKDAEFPGRYYFGTRAGIRGGADGSLFAFGRFGCAIELIDQAGEHCSGAVPSLADFFAPYATDGFTLLKYDGSIWTQVGGRFPSGDAGTGHGQALWAGASGIVVGGSNGYILTIQDEEVVTILPKPVDAYNITGVWSFGAKDIWAATEGGELHRYDGSQWTLQWTPTDHTGGSARLWGVDGHLFVVGYGQFAEWDGSALRSLLPSAQANRQFTDVWGSSPTEVFATSVATSDAQLDGCNAVELWWYDGTTARTM